MAKTTIVISHWYQLIENFQVSPLAFYDCVNQAIEHRFVPEASSSRIEHKESGLASANRQYLRIHRGKHAFDICAAPFGTGFFVSWWLTEPPLRFAFLCTIAIVFAVLAGISFAYFAGFALGVATGGLFLGIELGLVFGLCVPFALFLFACALPGTAPERFVLALPLIGWIYTLIVAPNTFYSIDTALMFQQTVHNAVLEVIDGMTTARGVRSLTETERKPVLKGFGASA